MMNTRSVASVLLVFAALFPTGHAEGQGIGGLIKKKVSESVKGDDKKGQQAGREDAATQQPSGSKLGRPLTQGTLAAFEKGLIAERDHRKGTVRFLATLKTRDQHNSCQQTVAASPEFQKIMMSMGTLGDNPTQEQVQKASEKMSADLNKLSIDKCGEDPGKYDEGWKSRQIAAAEVEGARTFAAALAGGAGNGPFFAFEVGPDEDFYRLLKEWVPPFCRLSSQAQQDAADKGIAIPGSGRGIAFVYTADEAKALKLICPSVMRLLAELQ